MVNEPCNLLKAICRSVRTHRGSGLTVVPFSSVISMSLPLGRHSVPLGVNGLAKPLEGRSFHRKLHVRNLRRLFMSDLDASAVRWAGTSMGE